MKIRVNASKHNIEFESACNSIAPECLENIQNGMKQFDKNSWIEME